MIVAVVFVVAVHVGACGADPEPPSSGEQPDSVIELEIFDGELVDGPVRRRVPLGGSVTINVTGNTNEVVHVHGYDLFLKPVNGEGALGFDALIPGRFEIELEGTGRLLAELTVS